MSQLLQTQEVGSLAKPDWRVQPVTHGTLTDAHIAGAHEWARRLDIPADEVEHSLRPTQQWLASEGVLDAVHAGVVRNLAAQFAVRLQEKAGIDILFDGEQDRPEMYQDAIAKTNGFAWRGHIRAFDKHPAKSFLKAAVVGPPSIKEPWHTDETERLQDLTSQAIKVPITGAYTLADWSFDEYYQRAVEQGGRGLSRAAAKRQFVYDLSDNVVRPNIQALLEAGATWVQIDEPAATTKPDEVPLFVEAFNRSVAGLVGKFSVHICFSDYSLLFPHVQGLEDCSQFSLEFANRDPRTLGTDLTRRPAYEVLRDFRAYTPEIAIGLGVTSVHDNDIEAPDLVRDRVVRATNIIGDPGLIYPSPDCGLRTRSWDVAFKKLQATAEGTALARAELGL